jgi:hypothetical protein
MSASAAGPYYRDTFGFRSMHSEGVDFAIVDRDGCRIILKRGPKEPSESRNRHRNGDGWFYDLLIQCDSMPAFDALRAELLTTKPDQLSEIGELDGMREFSAHDLDGYKISFARSV